MRLLAHLSEKWEKEMQAKLDEIAAGEGKASSSSGSSTKKKSGLLGKIAGAVKSVVGGDALAAVHSFLKFPGVKAFLGKVSGPVLAAGATALGFGAAAPVLLQYGSKAVDAVADVATAASSSGGSTATGGASGSGAMSDAKRQQLTMEIQRIYDKQKEMFGLVSNILKTNHDSRLAVINNIR